MLIKSGVVIAGLNINMRPVLIAADAVWKSYGQELVVTAGLDGMHSAGSLHYYGMAIDCRTNYFDKGTTTKIAEELRDRLGEDYDVCIEPSHIHIEYDPKHAR